MSQTSSSVPTPFKVLVGLGLFVGGAALHSSWHPEFYKTLEGQGVPLDFGITLSAIGVLLFTFPIIDMFFVKPLQAALHERNSALETTFSEVEELRNEMTSMKANYEKQLAATEAEAREKINSQIKEAQALRQTVMSEATEKADAMVKQAQDEINMEKNRVLADLRSHVTDLALAAAEKVVAENMDNDRNRKLIADFIQQAEVAK